LDVGCWMLDLDMDDVVGFVLRNFVLIKFILKKKKHFWIVWAQIIQIFFFFFVQIISRRFGLKPSKTSCGRFGPNRLEP
jgi:hypothetical protein